MSEFNVTVEGGKSVRLTTAGKYCDRDIVVTAQGGHDLLPAVIERTATEIQSDGVVRVGVRAFYQYDKLVSVSFPFATEVGNNGFYRCYALESVYLPMVEKIGSYAFQDCSVIESFHFANCKVIDTAAFYACKNLKVIDLPALADLGNQTFYNCTSLQAVIIRSSSVVKIYNSNAFASSSVAAGTGYIYVPSSLVDSYCSATFWKTYADQIRAIEDYPEITGG
jgi:hypothetical protein